MHNSRNYDPINALRNSNLFPKSFKITNCTINKQIKLSISAPPSPHGAKKRNSHLLPDLPGPKIQVLSSTLLPVQYSVPLLEQYDQEEGLPNLNIVTSTSPVMSEIHQPEYLNRVIQKRKRAITHTCCTYCLCIMH